MTSETVTVTSSDGTTIELERAGSGRAVVLVGGVLGDRSQQEPVAELLAPRFITYNYDRRGRGNSGFTPPYSVDHEVEDLAAVITHAGGEACVFATSGCSVIALHAAAAGVPITRLALWEPPFVVDDTRPPPPADYRDQLEKMLADNRRGDMVALFLTEAAAIPAPFVDQMRQAPFWGAREAFAHTLVNEAAMMGDFSVPAVAASADVPTVVLDGGTTPWLSAAADVVAGVLPDARRKTLPGQQHNVEPTAIAPALGADADAARPRRRVPPHDPPRRAGEREAPVPQRGPDRPLRRSVWWPPRPPQAAWPLSPTSPTGEPPDGARRTRLALAAAGTAVPPTATITTTRRSTSGPHRRAAVSGARPKTGSG